ncbi:Pre-mRNA-splicing factor 18 [Symbiodinium microadriaticum]|uniref:Pre-mRNA-splicing factor 18 n=1 Tax=Symbiodinium microadriaticum TaxID=2951 RepID=A0A1Q9CBA8_SYMMI|nr:Pre-mRNA-splicing factor 18 [Symbiodinium microadriaticum]
MKKGLRPMDLLKSALAERQAKAGLRPDICIKLYTSPAFNPKGENCISVVHETGALVQPSTLLARHFTKSGQKDQESKKEIPAHLLDEALLQDDDAEPPMPLEDIVSRFRQMGQPIILFGETDMQRYKRMRQLEREDHEGKKNPDLVMLEAVHANSRTMIEDQTKDKDDEDEDEEEGEKKQEGEEEDEKSEASESEEEKDSEKDSEKESGQDDLTGDEKDGAAKKEGEGGEAPKEKPKEEAVEVPEVDFEASKTNVGSKGPKFLRSELLAVNEVSVSKESGWRPLDWGRVSELVADFKSGAYGQNTLAPPSLIDSAACLCDGKRRPDNGLQCVAALQILTGELEESEANSEAVDLGTMDQCDMIRSWVRKSLKAWEKELADLPDEEKKKPSTKTAVAAHRQVRRDVRPLQKRLRMYRMEEWLLDKIYNIVKKADDREYREAAEAYLDLTIGKAAWPVGIGCGGSMLMEDAIGLHDRFNRNAQVKDVAYALNDEVTRKFVQALKRLMNAAQKNPCTGRQPTPPKRQTEPGVLTRTPLLLTARQHEPFPPRLAV